MRTWGVWTASMLPFVFGSAAAQAALFDCSKAYLGVDYVICASPTIKTLTEQLGDAYLERRNALVGDARDALVASQRAWVKGYGVACGLPARGKPPGELIASSSACVENAVRARLGELETTSGTSSAQTGALPSPSPNGPSPDDGADGASTNVKTEQFCPFQVATNLPVGFADAVGNWVIPPQFEAASSFSDGLARVMRNGKDGYIDRTGREVIPPQFENAAFSFSDGLAYVTRNGKQGYIDRTGREVIPPQFESAGSFSDGLAYVVRNGKYGYIDRTGREVVPPQFEWAGSFSDGLAYVVRNGKYGYIDRTGREVIPPQFESAGSFSDGLARVKRNGKFGYIDRTGREVIPPQFEDANSFSDGLASVKRNGKYGYIDRTGREVIPPQFESASSFSDGLAYFKRNGKEGYIDRTGREVIPPQFESASSFSDGLTPVKRNGKYGYIDRTGREVVPLRYASVSRCPNGVFTAVENDGDVMRLLASDGTPIAEFDRQIEARYPDLYVFSNLLRDGDPQKMYLAAGGYARKHDEAKARKLYDAIIERFPSSDFAVKANDQLLAAQRVEETKKAQAGMEKARAERAASQQPSEPSYRRPGASVAVHLSKGGQCGGIMITPGQDKSEVQFTSFCDFGFFQHATSGEKIWVPNEAISSP